MLQAKGADGRNRTSEDNREGCLSPRSARKPRRVFAQSVVAQTATAVLRKDTMLLAFKPDSTTLSKTSDTPLMEYSGIEPESNVIAHF